MKLSKITILALRGMDRYDRQRIADSIGVTEQTFYKWIRTNDDELTKAACLTILRKELGYNDDVLLEQITTAA